MFQRLTRGYEDSDSLGRRSIRAHSPLRRAVRLLHRAIVAAKLRRLRGELICRAGLSVDASATPVADAGRWPRAPLVLGDKWDF